MISFFATGKSFVGHSGIIQRNALRSWKLLHPDVEVILFGDDEGAREVCAEFGLVHHPLVERHASGPKYLNFMFERAQKIAHHDYLCYSNCDIVLMQDFYEAFHKASAWRKKILMIGQRWDTDITTPIEFDRPDWDPKLRAFAQTKGNLQYPEYVDYFLFPKGLYDQVPPLVVGRDYWDHWLVWKALDRGATVLDVSSFVVAVHQNHGYGYHPCGKKGVHEDELALRNIVLAGDGKHLRFILDASHRLHCDGRIRRTMFRRTAWDIKFRVQKAINLTYPVRRALGLQRRAWLGNLIGSSSSSRAGEPRRTE